MMFYRGICFDDYSNSEDAEYDYNWSQICTACACKYGIYTVVAKNDCPATLKCGVEGCCEEADFYIDFDGSEIIVDDRYIEGYRTFLEGKENYSCEMESWGESSRVEFTKGYEEARALSRNSFKCCMYDEPRTFDWCETNCDKYYSCDTVALAYDDLKIREETNNG